MLLYLKGLIHEYNWVQLATALKYNAVQLYLLVDMVDKIDDVERLSKLDNGDSELWGLNENNGHIYNYILESDTWL